MTDKKKTTEEEEGGGGEEERGGVGTIDLPPAEQCCLESQSHA